MSLNRKHTDSKKQVDQILASIGIKPTSKPREERGSFSFVGGTPREIIIQAK